MLYPRTPTRNSHIQGHAFKQYAPKIDARTAASAAICVYLESIEFENDNHVFKLNYCNSEWPKAGQTLDYPCASLIDSGPQDYEYNFTPYALEDTCNLYEQNTVLWKTDELTINFQLDIFTGGTLALDERNAIAAKISMIFNPWESRYGVVLNTTPLYFDRTVRATLINQVRTDSSASSYEKERRLTYEVRAEIDNVHLRETASLQPVVTEL